MKANTRKFVNVLQAKHNQYQHLRIGQLIDNAVSTWKAKHNSSVSFFYMRDEDLLNALIEYNP